MVVVVLGDVVLATCDYAAFPSFFHVLVLGMMHTWRANP